jgi:GT2 family glycosyltransferase
MLKHDYSITFACYNAVHYTKLCIDSFIKHNTPLDRLIVVDNGSSDETRTYLKDLPLGGLILNRENLGCGVAWNQGALAQQAEWSIIMNNDVLVSAGWVDSLIDAANTQNLKIISPALIEGPCDYDFETFSQKASKEMKHVYRMGNPHAVCSAVHKSVWMDIGYFQAMPKLWGYEDTMFFHAAKKAGIPMATTGASWLHHFGSITQSVMKRERGLQETQGLSGRRNYRYLNQSWLERKIQKYKKVSNLKECRQTELTAHSMTLHGVREQGNFNWF